MRYFLRVIRYLVTGRLTIRNALYVLRVKPIAVVSKDVTWIVDTDFIV